MGPGFFPAFREKINSLDEDQDARVIVLKAEGKSFTSGLNLLEAGDLLQIQGAWGREKLRQRIPDLQNCFSVLENISTPVIAAVHGHCIGAEVELTSTCDIRLASQDAVFSIKETRLAIIADLGTLQRLEPIIGSGLVQGAYFDQPGLQPPRKRRKWA